MLERPKRLSFYTGPRSAYFHPNSYYLRSPWQWVVCACIMTYLPFISVRIMNRIDRTGVWEQRIEKKRVRKMAFDYMLK